MPNPFKRTTESQLKRTLRLIQTKKQNHVVEVWALFSEYLALIGCFKVGLVGYPQVYVPEGSPADLPCALLVLSASALGRLQDAHSGLLRTSRAR